MSRRGTHRTNTERTVRTVMTVQPGRSYQQVLQQLRSDPPARGVCARCGDAVVRISGTWYSTDDQLAFCDGFVAHDDLDGILGGFAPSHEVDPGLVAVEDDCHDVHPHTAWCAACDLAATALENPQRRYLTRLAEHVVHHHGSTWEHLDDATRATLLAAAVQAWEQAPPAPPLRHGAARKAVEYHLSRFIEDGVPLRDRPDSGR